MESTNINLEIFKFIADLVQNPDFSGNTREFMAGSWKSFSDEDENKLEYT